MDKISHTTITVCSRCNGSGRFSNKFCYGCHGLGISPMHDYHPFKEGVDTLLLELGQAELIMRTLLDAMTLQQKEVVTAQFEGADTSVDSVVRTNERRAALARFGIELFTHESKGCMQRRDK